MRVGIVGLGLIGGSMAKSVKARTGHTVYGVDLDQETMMLARMCGAIDGALDGDTLPQCDLILVAVRPGAAVRWVRDHAGQIAGSAILVDLCGVKRTVVAQIAPIAAERGFAYIGGHPMAGKERGGFTSSSDSLYVGASMILTPDEHTDMKLLAHIVSSAYVKSPEAQRRRGFSAGSFQDMTRVARLDEDMWTELFLDDADFLTKELGVLIGHLEEYRQALETRDTQRLHDLLKEGRELKATAGGN